MQSSLSAFLQSGKRLSIALALAAVPCVFVSAQDIPLNVTYICNGEHIYVENCNIRDLSDNANCMVAHPDKLTPTGMNSYTYVTRGALKKLLPTCQQPSAKQVAAAKAMEQKQQDAYNAAVARANPQPAPAARPANSSAGGNYAMPAPPKNAEERAMRRCVSSGRPSTTCTGNSLLGMFGQMVSQVLPGANKEPEPGPNMAGVFQGAGDWRLDFIDNGVLVNCGVLSPNQQGYALDLKNGRATLTIATTPKPLVLAVHARRHHHRPRPRHHRRRHRCRLHEWNLQRDAARHLRQPVRRARQSRHHVTRLHQLRTQARHLPGAQPLFKRGGRRHTDHANRSAEDSLWRRQGPAHADRHSHARHLRRLFRIQRAVLP